MFVAGGFKVWECSVDLIGFLSLHQFVFKDKLVLEVLYHHISNEIKKFMVSFNSCFTTGDVHYFLV